MSLVALLAPALFDLIETARPQMVCAFRDADGPAAVVRVIDRDFEMTTNGQFKIGVFVGNEALAGRAAPYTKSDARDVVLRARSDEAVYLIALREDGTAVLRYRRDGVDEGEVTSRGTCSGFETHLDRWLSS
jgi:hypothetical protein